MWQGYYREAGINVELRSGIDRSGKEVDALAAVARGEADLALLDGLDGLAVLVAQDKGADLIALQPLLQNASWVFYSLPDQPLSDLHDLSGKTIAASSDGLALYKLALQKAGIPFDPDRVIEAPPVIESLLNRKADIVPAHAESMRWAARQYGVQLSAFYIENHGLDFYGDVITANSGKFNASPHVIKRFLKATARGWAYAFDHQDETIAQMIACYFHKTTNSNLISLNHYLANRYLKLSRYPEIAIGENDPVRWRRVHAALKISVCWRMNSRRAARF